MLEKTLERKFSESVKAMGGISLKLICPGFDGMPDRIALLPGGRLAFIEFKRHGMKPRPLQESRHGMLCRLGFKVFVVDSEKDIERVLDEIQSA